MKLIHVEVCFDPTAGYQINELISKSDVSKLEIIIITSDDMSRFHKNVDAKKDKEFEEKYNVKIIRLKKIFEFSSRIYMRNLFSTIDNLKPDAVFLHGIGDLKDLQLLKKQKDYIIFRDCHMSWAGSRNTFRDSFLSMYSKTFAKIIKKIIKNNEYVTDEMRKYFLKREYSYQNKFLYNLIKSELDKKKRCELGESN